MSYSHVVPPKDPTAPGPIWHVVTLHSYAESTPRRLKHRDIDTVEGSFADPYTAEQRALTLNRHAQRRLANEYRAAGPIVGTCVTAEIRWLERRMDTMPGVPGSTDGRDLLCARIRAGADVHNIHVGENTSLTLIESYGAGAGAAHVMQTDGHHWILWHCSGDTWKGVKYVTP